MKQNIFQIFMFFMFFFLTAYIEKNYKSGFRSLGQGSEVSGKHLAAGCGLNIIQIIFWTICLFFFTQIHFSLYKEKTNSGF